MCGEKKEETHEIKTAKPSPLLPGDCGHFSDNRRLKRLISKSGHSFSHWRVLPFAVLFVLSDYDRDRKDSP
jgi:hypothetical protein